MPSAGKAAPCARILACCACRRSPGVEAETAHFLWHALENAVSNAAGTLQRPAPSVRDGQSRGKSRPHGIHSFLQPSPGPRERPTCFTACSHAVQLDASRAPLLTSDLFMAHEKEDTLLFCHVSFGPWLFYGGHLVASPRFEQLQAMTSLASAMRIFANSGNLPVLVHCIHGKDRTGLVIALLLLLLGVEEDMVGSGTLCIRNALGFFAASCRLFSCTKVPRSHGAMVSATLGEILHGKGRMRDARVCCPTDGASRACTWL
jgi:Tyrosine phosphatase family